MKSHYIIIISHMNFHEFPAITLVSSRFPTQNHPAWPPASLRLRCATLPRLPLTVWGSWRRSTTAWRQLRIADEAIWMCLGIIQVDVFNGTIMKNPCSQLRLMEKLESWKIWRKHQAYHPNFTLFNIFFFGFLSVKPLESMFRLGFDVQESIVFLRKWWSLYIFIV